MSVPISSAEALYLIFQNIVEGGSAGTSDALTDWFQGSILDTLAGVFALAGVELENYTQQQFNKTFFTQATGPVNPGDNDDLQTLAVDHFGNEFERPLAVAAIDTVTFSRLNNTGGVVPIEVGTIIQTEPDANGNVQQYTTNETVTMTASSISTDLSVSVSVTAIVPGSSGDAAEGTIVVISTSLLDTTIVCTNAGNATGLDAPDDTEYLSIIQNLIASLAGATIAAVQAAALAVPGVISATPVETGVSVRAYNIATGVSSGAWFWVTQTSLYIADATGTASTALLNAVQAAISPVRALGVYINVAAATAQSVSWTGHMSLNPEGPNYAVLSVNSAMVTTAMKNYINSLPTGTSFIVATANAYILSLYGAAGTNDLTGFTTSVPSGDVSLVGVQKAVAGTVALG